MALEKELVTFEREKQRLLAEGKGKFVLIMGDQVVGVYTSYDDALSAGYKEFGKQEFLVKEITETEAVYYFTRHVL